VQLEWLKTFVIAGTHENFRIAADKQFITQPAVTFQIKQLEKEIGLRLFERNGRRIALTEAGELFLKYAEQILNDYSQALEALAAYKKGYRTHLTIAASPLVASTQLTYIIRRFIHRYPNVEVAVQVMESHDIESAVVEGKADVGLSRAGAVRKNVEQTVISEDPVVMVIPYEEGFSDSGASIDLESIFHKYTLITHNHPEYWDDLLKDLRARYTFKTMVVSQVSTTKRFIEEGIGFSFLPHSTVRREIAEGRLAIVDEHPFDLPTTRTYLLKHRATARARRFERFVLELLR